MISHIKYISISYYFKADINYIVTIVNIKMATWLQNARYRILITNKSNFFL